MERINIDAMKNILRKNKNSIDVKKVTRYFISKGLDKSIPSAVIAGEIDLDSLNEENLIHLLYSIGLNSNINTTKYLELFDREYVYKVLNVETEDFNPIENPNERQKNIIEFIKNTYGKQNTRRINFNYYKSFIEKEEERIDKDLKDFTKDDIETLVNNSKCRKTSKRSLFVLLSRYFDYCVDNKYIFYNVVNDIDRERIIQDNVSAPQSQYMPFDELYTDLIKLELSEDKSITVMDSIIVLLLRSGLKLEEVAQLKFSDFDRSLNRVTYKNGGKLKNYKLDSRIFDLLDRHKETNETTGGKYGNSHTLNIVDDRIIKTVKDYYDLESAKWSIRRRLSKFGEFGYKYHMTASHLNLSHKIDILNNMKKIKGYINKKDFENVQVNSGLKPASWYKIKTEYNEIMYNMNSK